MTVIIQSASSRLHIRLPDSNVPMAAVLPPSTPKSSPSVDTQSPGKWQHPRLREIVRRQNATTFDNRNIQRILVNGGALIVTMVMANIMRS